jgi:undecaprenyl-diphosphatase
VFEAINKIDQDLFLKINSCHLNELDSIMKFISDKSWFIIIPVIIVLSILKYKKKFWVILLSISLAWGLADLTSTRLFKYNIKRLRPCHVVEIKDKTYVPFGCGGNYGFVSSHAANSMAIAVLMLATFEYSYIWLFFLWSIIICYTRIYLGVHYPADVIFGAVVGAICGIIINKMITKKLLKNNEVS